MLVGESDKKVIVMWLLKKKIIAARVMIVLV